MEKHVEEIIAFNIALCLCIQRDAPFATVCKSFSTAAETIAREDLVIAIPSAAARAQLSRLLNANDRTRGCLLWKMFAERRVRQIEVMEQIGNVAKSMHTWISSASITAGDVFAACKRAMLLCGDPLTITPEVEIWMMYIVEAVDSDCFENSLPAWQWFVEHGVLDEGHVLWLLQLAHALDDLSSATVLLNTCPEIAEHAVMIARKLSSEPSLGKYGSCHSRMKDKDIQRLITKAQSQRCSSDISETRRQEPVPLSIMLRASRSERVSEIGR